MPAIHETYPQATSYRDRNEPPQQPSETPNNGLAACLKRIQNIVSDIGSCAGDFNNLADHLSGAIPSTDSEKNASVGLNALFFTACGIELELVNHLNYLRQSRNRISEAMA